MRRKTQAPFLMMALACTLLTPSLARAGAGTPRCATCLGPVSSALPPHSPLGAWFRHGAVIRSHGVPELIFIGGLADQYSGPERWAVTKALGEFGSWTAVTPETRAAFGAPTLNWTRGRLRSRYVRFDDVEVFGYHNELLHRPSGLARALYDHYVGTFNPGPAFQHLPTLAVGGYVEVGPGVSTGDLESQTTMRPLSFSAVQHALARGYGRGSPLFVYDINVEANLIIAFICRTDGKRPASVCGKPAIKTLLRRIH